MIKREVVYLLVRYGLALLVLWLILKAIGELR